MRLGIVFWFYRDVAVCENRLRLLRRRNPGLPIFGLYGGPRADAPLFDARLSSWLDDFWAFPDEVPIEWKWRNGDLMLTRWFTERGTELHWDHVFVAQWDMVVTAHLESWLPSMGEGEMLLSGLRPLTEVEKWWQWTSWEQNRPEYEQFMAHVRRQYGVVDDPMCCQFIGLVVPRQFFAAYQGVDRPELGFLEYKVPVYAEVLGMRLVPDTVFRPWWPEDPAHSPRRREQLVHAWSSQVRLPMVLAEALRPAGRRAFHPYRGIYPHDVASLGHLIRARRERRLDAADTS
ncbi:MAG TPA: hypothetical protein VK386_02000 [Acidimicrobiales bacterium]|nr:hypothetical protein [Acidimicrobiales bacterium]